MQINKNLKLIAKRDNLHVYIQKTADFLYFADFNKLSDGSELCVSAIFLDLTPDIMKLLVSYLELSKKFSEKSDTYIENFRNLKPDEYIKINDKSRFVIKQYQERGYVENIEVRQPNDWHDLPKFIQEYIKLENAQILSKVKLDEDIYKFVIYFIQEGLLKIASFIVYIDYINNKERTHLFKQSICPIDHEIALETVNIFMENMEPAPKQ